MDIPRSIIVPTKYDLAGTNPDNADDYNQDLQIKNYDLGSSTHARTSVSSKGLRQDDDITEYDIILENFALPSNGPIDNDTIGDLGGESNMYYDLEGDKQKLSGSHGQENEFNNIQTFGVDSEFNTETDVLNNCTLNNTTMAESFVPGYESDFKNVNGNDFNEKISEVAPIKAESNDGGKLPFEENNENNYALGNGVSSVLIPEYGLLDNDTFLLMGVNGQVGANIGDMSYMPMENAKELDMPGGNMNATLMDEFCGTTSNVHNNGLWDEGFGSGSLADLLFNDTNSGEANEKMKQQYQQHKHSASLPELFSNSIYSGKNGISSVRQEDMRYSIDNRGSPYSHTSSRSADMKRVVTSMPTINTCKTKRCTSESGPVSGSKTSTRSKTVGRKRPCRNSIMHHGTGCSRSGGHVSTCSSSTCRSSASSRSSRSRSRSNSISPCGENVYEGSSLVRSEANGNDSGTAQKGDTITLRQPSFAEGREDVGSFGFINFRKPGAWTRVKPHRNDGVIDEGE